MRRMSISSSENFEGKLFVQFLSLIYLSYIKKQMDENGLYKKYTMQTLLDDLDIIELYQQPGKAHHLSAITRKQMVLYDAMGVAIPSNEYNFTGLQVFLLRMILGDFYISVSWLLMQKLTDQI